MVRHPACLPCPGGVSVAGQAGPQAGRLMNPRVGVGLGHVVCGRWEGPALPWSSKSSEQKKRHSRPAKKEGPGGRQAGLAVAPSPVQLHARLWPGINRSSLQLQGS